MLICVKESLVVFKARGFVLIGVNQTKIADWSGNGCPSR